MKFDMVSFDPGETTGVAIWDYNHAKEKGRPWQTHQFKQTELDEFLYVDIEGKDINKFVIEEYMINPKIPHNWSKAETIQVIGQLKGIARIRKIEIVMQRPSILPVAEGWSGIRREGAGGHANSHWRSAVLHGYYYLHKNGIIPARVVQDDIH